MHSMGMNNVGGRACCGRQKEILFFNSKIYQNMPTPKETCPFFHLYLAKSQCYGAGAASSRNIWHSMDVHCMGMHDVGGRACCGSQKEILYFNSKI
jgi:hypothetical protein